MATNAPALASGSVALPVAQSVETPKKASTAVGPRDGKKAFDRIKSICDKLDPDVRRNTIEAISQYSALQNKMEAGNAGVSS